MTVLLAMLSLLLAACFAGPNDYDLPVPDVDGYLGPAIVGADPADGSYGIAQDYPIRVTFSEAIAYLQVRSVRATTSGGGLPISFTLSNDSTTLLVEGPWPAQRALTLRLDATIIGASGQALRDQDLFDGEPYTPFALHFTTGAGNRDSPPLILSVSPSHQETGVAATASPEICFSKPMRPALVSVRLSADGADEVTASYWSRSNTCVAINRSGGLRYGTQYELQVAAAVDAGGIPMQEPLRTSFVTRSGPGRVRINEVVTAPLRDWNDSEGGDGVPFNGEAGTGSITTSDEYIEIHNGTGSAVSLRGWTLAQKDGSDQLHAFGEGASVTERFSNPASSIDAFQPGDYLVVGNPVGDNQDDVSIELFDADGYERDAVKLGGGGAPSGAAAATEEESVARIQASDSGLGETDWQKATASPGEPNP